MDNLWLLTEERPKPSVVRQILNMYCIDFYDEMYVDKITICPIIEDGIFRFAYEVEGISVKNADRIFIKL